jgi:glutamate racemase
VQRYSRQIVRFLKTQDIKAIVVACNTATAFALEEVRQEAGIPVIGVIEPGARVACEASVNGRIGVIATRATISSEAYSEQIHAIRPDARVISKACPLLVPLVEEGWLHDTVTDEVIMRYLDEVLEHGIDTLILGCTHYPLLRSAFRKLLGDSIRLVNPAYETAQALSTLLAEKNLAAPDPGSGPVPDQYRFYVSDEPERFADFARSILPMEVRSVSQIPIEDY